MYEARCWDCYNEIDKTELFNKIVKKDLEINKIALKQYKKNNCNSEANITKYIIDMLEGYLKKLEE